MDILALWIIFSFIAAIIAMTKHRSGLGIFGLSLLLSPLVGGIVAICMEPGKVGKPLVVGMKKCPFCAENIKVEATVCRYCQREQPAAVGET